MLPNQRPQASLHTGGTVSGSASAGSLADQSCLRISLRGLLDPGTAVEFNVSTDATVDLLLFSSTGVAVYQQEQRDYRQS